jgi:hypothetical protein
MINFPFVLGFITHAYSIYNESDSFSYPIPVLKAAFWLV